MKNSMRLSLGFMGAIFLLTTQVGCSTLDQATGKGYLGADALIVANRTAAEEILSQLEKRDISRDAFLLIGTASHSDDLNRSSMFGRLLSEEVSARMTQGGFRMIELKLQQFAFLKQKEGEFFLTREIQHLAKSHSAEAVIVATYATANKRVYINLKVVEATTNSVLAAHDYAIGMDRNLRSLLGIPEPYRDRTFLGRMSEWLDL